MKHYFSAFFLCISTLVHASNEFGSSTLKTTNKRTTWESTHYIWNFGLITLARKGLLQNPERYFTSSHFNKALYTNIQSGNVVFVSCHHLPTFCTEILPTLTNPIVLIVADGDESFPTECGNNFDVNVLLNHPCVTHIFAQNNVLLNHPKVSSLPIGMDFHTIGYKGKNGGWGEKGSPREQEEQLNKILSTLKPTHARKKRIFIDFQLADTMHGGLNRYLQCGEDRKTIFQRILKTGLVDYAPSFMRRSKLWEKKGEYAFSVSPHGNGLDCHRTWEDLVLGCIVIVKTSPLDLLYEGLPVVIVQDWSEITEQNLTRWLKEHGDAFTRPSYREKLTNRYWINKIQTKLRSLA